MSLVCLHQTGKKYLEFEDDVEQEVGLLVEQKEWPHKFNRPGRAITWKLESDTNDIEGTKKEEKMIAYALLAWAFETNIEIRKAKPGEVADIKISFKNKSNEKMFKERPSTLAFAWFPGQRNVEGIVVFNDEYLWTVNGKPINAEAYHKITGRDVVPGSTYKTYDFQHTCTHELGHTLGLRHESNYSNHVMWPYYNKQRVPQHNDLKRIQAKYGIRKLSPWKRLVIKIILARGPRV